jgi:anti-anti-sigma factor
MGACPGAAVQTVGRCATLPEARRTSIMDLDLSTSRADDRAVVTAAGEVDLETAAQLGDHALEALRDVSPHLVLDLSGVTFMDSTGLKVLLSIQRRADLSGGTLALAGATRPVRKILALTGLDQTFRLFDSVADAQAAPPSSVSDGAAPTT